MRTKKKIYQVEMGDNTRALTAIGAVLFSVAIILSILEINYEKKKAEELSGKRHALLYDLDYPTTCSTCNVSLSNGMMNCPFKFMNAISDALVRTRGMRISKWIELVDFIDDAKDNSKIIMPLIPMNFERNADSTEENYQEIAFWHTAIDLSKKSEGEAFYIYDLCDGGAYEENYEQYISWFESYSSMLEELPIRLERKKGGYEECGPDCDSCMDFESWSSSAASKAQEGSSVKLIQLSKRARSSDMNGGSWNGRMQQNHHGRNNNKNPWVRTRFVRDCENVHILRHSKYHSELAFSIFRRNMRYFFGFGFVMIFFILAFVKPIDRYMKIHHRKNK